MDILSYKDFQYEGSSGFKPILGKIDDCKIELDGSILVYSAYSGCIRSDIRGYKIESVDSQLVAEGGELFWIKDIPL